MLIKALLLLSISTTCLLLSLAVEVAGQETKDQSSNSSYTNNSTNLSNSSSTSSTSSPSDDGTCMCTLQTSKIMQELKNFTFANSNCAIQVEKKCSQQINTLKSAILQKNDALNAQYVKQSEQMERLKDSIDQLQRQNSTGLNKSLPSPVECQRIKLLANLTKLVLVAASAKKYYASPFPMPWALARIWCLSMGMKMPLLKKAKDMDQVASELKKLGFGNNNYWLAASDIGQAVPGKFKWTDETPVDGSTWQPTRPNNARQGAETCVHIFSGTGRLADATCSTNNSISMLCEISDALTLCL